MSQIQVSQHAPFCLLFRVECHGTNSMFFLSHLSLHHFYDNYTNCRRFKAWIATEYVSALQHNKEPPYPSWLFPNNLRPLSKALLTLLLHPDPKMRPSASEALRDPWFSHDPNANASTLGAGIGFGSYSNEEKGNMVGTVFSNNHFACANTRTLSTSSSTSSSSVKSLSRRKGGASPILNQGRTLSPSVSRTHSPTSSSSAFSSLHLSAP